MDSLLRQYQLLSDKEQNSILVYKSSLGLLINRINNLLSENNDIESLLSNNDFITEATDYYEEFKEFYKRDLILRHTLLKNINMKSIVTFIMSIIDINYTLLGCVDKIKLDEDMKLYRLVSYKDTCDDIAKSELVSTTTDMDVCGAFLRIDKQYALFELDVEKGTPVLICPYAIKAHYDSIVDYLQGGKPKKITIQEGDNQNELILFKSRCLFDTISEEEIEKDGFHLRLIKTKVKNKELDSAKTI